MCQSCCETIYTLQRTQMFLMYFYSVQDDREINVADSTIYRSTRSFWSHFFIFSWSDEAYKKKNVLQGQNHQCNLTNMCLSAYVLATLVWMAQILLLQHRSELDMYKITHRSHPYLKSKIPKRKEWRKVSRGTRSSGSAPSSWLSSWP